MYYDKIESLTGDKAIKENKIKTTKKTSGEPLPVMIYHEQENTISRWKVKSWDKIRKVLALSDHLVLVGLKILDI